jgi:hypothetical protein
MSKKREPLPPWVGSLYYSGQEVNSNNLFLSHLLLNNHTYLILFNVFNGLTIEWANKRLSALDFYMPMCMGTAHCIPSYTESCGNMSR